MIIASPTAIAEMKKNTGSSGLHQKACSLLGMMRYRVPSDDWCSVERITPRMTKTIITLRTALSARVQPRRSKTMGENSSASTVV